MARPFARNGNASVTISILAALAALGRQPGNDDLGVREAYRGDAYSVPGAPLPGDDLGHHLALGRRPVCQHWFAGHVADREDAAHRGTASVIDVDEWSVHVEVDRFQVPPFGCGFAADRDEDPVGLDRHG